MAGPPHQQKVVEALKLPPTPEETAKWQGYSLSEREKKVKGVACDTCGRNCPDADPATVARVWCWECVLKGKHRQTAQESPASRASRSWLQVQQLRDLGRGDEADALAKQLEAQPKTTAARRVSTEPREPNQTETMMTKLGLGQESYVFQGTKATNVFTQGSKPSTIAVQDHKGVTTYDLANEDHNRIIKGRLDRWLRKDKPTIKPGKVPVKGQKLDVVIRGGE